MPVTVQYIVRSDGHRMFAVLMCVSLVGGGSLVGRRGEGKAEADLCAGRVVLD